MPLAVGDQYAGFTISGLLGAGATGTVYLATDDRDGSQVALKILRAVPSGDEAFRTRFGQVNDALKRLQIPGAARVVDSGERRGRLWIASEYVPGIDADTLLHEHFPRGIAHRSLCLIADKVARTLDGAHAAGLLHRDVKPANIILDEPFSANYRVVLTDFGQGSIDPDGKAFRYASPELLSRGRIGPRSDQFALAATIFHLLTGRPAFHDPDRVLRKGRVQFDEAALAVVLNAPAGLTDVFTRAFAVDPVQRYASCDEFAAAFRNPEQEPAQRFFAQPEPSAEPSAEPIAPTDEPARRQRSILITAGVALLATVAVTTGVVMTSKSRPETAPGKNSSAAAGTPAAAPAPAPECRQLDAAIGQLTPKQKLAQLLMVGVQGLDDAQSVVHDQNVGGIMIGSWTDLTMMDEPLRALESEDRPIPLAVSVDEEGGRVSRLKSIIGQQGSPRSLVQQGLTPDQVRAIAKKRGDAMKELGITVDFAPVVDTTDADPNTVIGDRSFSNDPQKVVDYAGAYAAGLRDAGILPVLKHFPGHGHASGDSHKTGVITPPLSELKTHDLIPYVSLTQQAPVAVMVGHMDVPDLTGGEQASLSPAAYDLLRTGGYGEGAQPFTGPIFTDDLSSMKAISNDYTVPEAVLKALQAGADNALWITTKEVPGVLKRLQQALDNGELTQDRVDASVRTMAKAKNPVWARCTA